MLFNIQNEKKLSLFVIKLMKKNLYSPNRPNSEKNKRNINYYMFMIY